MQSTLALRSDIYLLLPPKCWDFKGMYHHTQPELFCVWVLICMCTTHVPAAFRGQKRASDSLGLELQTVVSHHVDAGNWTWVLCENKSALKCWANSPILGFFKYVLLILKIITYIVSLCTCTHMPQVCVCVFVCVCMHMCRSEDSLQESVPSFHWEVPSFHLKLRWSGLAKSTFSHQAIL